MDLEGFQLRPVDDARFVLMRLGRRAFPPLRSALGASETYLRNHALEVVTRIGPAAHELAPIIRPLLGDTISRSYACRALAAIGDQEAVPWLLAFLDDTQLEIRCAAAAALGPLRVLEAKPRLEALARDTRTPMDLRVAAASSLAVFELERPWFHWLVELRKKGGYHAPSLDEILDELRQKAALDQAPSWR